MPARVQGMARLGSCALPWCGHYTGKSFVSAMQSLVAAAQRSGTSYRMLWATPPRTATTRAFTCPSTLLVLEQVDHSCPSHDYFCPSQHCWLVLFSTLQYCFHLCRHAQCAWRMPAAGMQANRCSSTTPSSTPWATFHWARRIMMQPSGDSIPLGMSPERSLDEALGCLAFRTREAQDKPL